MTTHSGRSCPSSSSLTIDKQMRRSPRLPPPPPAPLSALNEAALPACWYLRSRCVCMRVYVYVCVYMYACV